MIYVSTLMSPHSDEGLISGVPTSLPPTCLRSASSCACLTAALHSPDCFLHDALSDLNDNKSKKLGVWGEKVGDISENEGTHRTFKIYFVLSTFLLGIGLALYCTLRIIQACHILSLNIFHWIIFFSRYFL